MSQTVLYIRGRSKREQLRVAVGLGNVQFIFIRQVSSDAGTMWRGTCGHAAQWPTPPRFYAAAAAAAGAVMMCLMITN